MATRDSNPIVPTEILDPYPERVSSAAGARQTADVAAVDPGALNSPNQEPEPFPFAASLKTRPATVRVNRWPVASALFACLAQTVLAVAMSVGTVPIVIGVSAALSVLVCGLVLIVAQCMSLAGDR